MDSPLRTGPADGSRALSDDVEAAPLLDGSAAATPPSPAAAPPPPAAGWRRPFAALWSSGTACVLGSSATFTLASTIVKLVEDRIPVFEIVLCRAVFSSLVTVLTCHSRGLPVFGRTAPLALKLARGTIGATAMICSYESITRLPLSDSTVVFFLSPAITAILGYLILGERFGWLTTAGCAASLGGVVLVAQPGSAAVEWGRQRLLGMCFGLAGASLAAGAYICIRGIGKREHPLTIAMYFHVFSFLGSVVPLGLGYPQAAVAPTPPEAALLLLLAACSFSANLLVNRAFQIERAAKASAVNFSQVVFAWTIGVCFLGDQLTPLGVAGTCLIAAGVVTVNLDKMQGTPCSAAPAPDPASAKPALESELEPGRWWQRWWPRRRREEAVPDHSGRLKAKTSFRALPQVQLPQYAQPPVGGGGPDVALIASGPALRPLPAERAS